MGFFSKHDKLKAQQIEKSKESSELEKRQKINFVTTFSMLAKLARADGNVSKQEIQIITDLIDNRLKLNKEKKTFAIKTFNEARESEIPFEEYARRYKEINKNHPEMYDWLVELLLSVAFADNTFSKQERRIIETAKSIFGISEESFSKIKSHYTDQLEQSLSIIGCTREDSLDTINLKYQRLIKSYDLENLKNLGLPQEFIVLAEEKLRKIELAHKEVVKFKLQHT